MSLEVDVRKLELFNRISKEGSKRVADSLSQMSGMDAEIEVAKINIMHMDDVKTLIGSDRKVGIHVELTDPPYGYVLFLLDPADSERLAQSMIPGETEETDVDPTVYTFPQVRSLVELVKQIDIDTDVQTDTLADSSITDS